jgi:FixJ family two-component response regulator
MGHMQQRSDHGVAFRSHQQDWEPRAHCIYIVDDDPSMRVTLSSLFRSVDLRVELFGSAVEFLRHNRSDARSCLVLDIRLPGVNGLDFQEQLLNAGIRIPIVFMTGHADIPMSVRAMRAGAVDFLAKPFRDQDMLDAVTAALKRDQQIRETERLKQAVHDSFARISPREREIMELVTSGLMNKQVAGRLALSEITVKVHRSSVMKKMKAKSLADLVRMSDVLGLHPDQRLQL